MGNKVCIDGIWYELNKMIKKATVTTSGNKEKYQGKAVIPEVVAYEGVEYAVTEIGWGAFEDCCDLISIIIPESVTSIGYQAFKGTAWDDNLPDGMIYIGKVLYKYKGIMPANSSVEIIDGTIGIGCGAFEGCSGLTSITIPKSVTSIGNHAFKGTTWYDNQSDGVVYAGKVLYKYKGIMPPKTSIEITEGTIGISSGAFEDCSGLTSIIIPESVKEIGEYAFLGSGGLTSIIVAENNPIYDSRNGCNAIIETNSNTLIAGCSTTIIPECITKLGYGAFAYCYGLTSIAIPKSVTEMEEGAFYECSGLTSITIPENVTKISNYTFYGCSGLTSITIPENVTKIGDYAFWCCSGLTSITIPENVTKIGESAFLGCSGLTSIIIPESVKEIGEEAFSDCSSLTSIIVTENNPIYDSRNNCNAIIETKSNTLIAGCATTIIPESVTKIGNYVFYGCSSLTSITIPENVKEIGNWAFCGCRALTSINIPESMKKIGEYAFYDCRTLRSITIPENVKEIGNSAFCRCRALTSINIPENVKEIGDWAFCGCDSLKSITIPESVKNIGRYAFSDCRTLTSITIPESVQKIGSEAFGGCSGLTSITIPGNVNKIGEGVFCSCYRLTSIIVAKNNPVYDSRKSCNAIIETNSNTLIAGCATTILPESVTKIGNKAYVCCSGLTSITIPESVTMIEGYAFYNCISLTSITIPESMKKIEEGAFYGCSSLTSITIPESVTKISNYTFYDCSGLTTITIPESVKEIGRKTFHGCTNLKEIYCYNFSIDWNAAFDESLVGEITIHVPKHVLDSVKTNFKKIILIEAKVKKIELPTKIYLSEKSVRLLEQIITPSYATEQRLTWSSSNEEVAVVNSKGRVVALSSGTATITAMATDGSEVRASCEIVVRKMVESIQLSNTSISLVVGNAFLLSAIVTPKDAYDPSLIWSTTDDDIAMILSNGRIVAVSAGTATITAKANDGSEVIATCEVTVTQNRLGNANSSC